MLFKLFSFRKDQEIFIHNLSNSLAVLFLTNKDKKLCNVLKNIKNCFVNFNMEKEKQEVYIAEIIKSCVCKIGYRNNVLVKNNFKVIVDVYELEMCLICILKNFSRFGSCIIIEENNIYIFLKRGVCLEEYKYLIREGCNCSVLEKEGKLFLKW